MIVSYDRRKNALLEARPGFYPNNWFHYLRGYKHAFTSLVEDVLRENVSVDFLAHPILFVARHAVEIGLKANVYELEKYTKRRFTKIANCHKITKWLLEFSSQVNTFYDICSSKQIPVEETEKSQYIEYYKSLDQLVNGNDKFKGLGIIDDGSIKFRYPIEKVLDERGKPLLDESGNPIMKKVFEVTDMISIAEVERLFNESMVLLEHTINEFDQYMRQIDNN